MDKTLQVMINKALQALNNAHAPYSKFKVASCILTPQGHFFTGVNIENSSYGLTLCAESSAIANMVTQGEKEIKDIVILASSNALCSPCGACRQRIFEFATKDTNIHLCDHQQVLKTYKIDDLLPLGFKL